MHNWVAQVTNPSCWSKPYAVWLTLFPVTYVEWRSAPPPPIPGGFLNQKIYSKIPSFIGLHVIVTKFYHLRYTNKGLLISYFCLFLHVIRFEKVQPRVETSKAWTKLQDVGRKRHEKMHHNQEHYSQLSWSMWQYEVTCI